MRTQGARASSVGCTEPEVARDIWAAGRRNTLDTNAEESWTGRERPTWAWRREVGTGSGEVTGDQRGQGPWGVTSLCPYFTAQRAAVGAAGLLVFGQAERSYSFAPRARFHSVQVARRCPVVLADLQEAVTRVSGSLTTLELEPRSPAPPLSVYDSVCREL